MEPLRTPSKSASVPRVPLGGQKKGSTAFKTLSSLVGGVDTRRDADDADVAFEEVPLESVPKVVELTQTDMFQTFMMAHRGLNFRRYFYLNAVPEWRRKYIHYERLQRNLVAMYRQLSEELALGAAAPSDAQVESVVITLDMMDGGRGANFLSALLTELDKVENFYVEQRDYFQHRFHLLVSNIRRAANLSEFADMDASPEIVDPEATLSSMQSYVKALREKRQMSLASRSFRAAITEFVRGIDMLQSYCSMNKLAVIQLLGRYERVSAELERAELPDINDSVQSAMEGMSFCQAGKELPQMQEDIETIFTRAFYPNREPSETHLAPVKLKRKYQRAVFIIGGCLGLILAGAILIVYLLAQTDDVRSLPDWDPTYFIFRGMFLTILMLWYIGINMYGWKKALINFRFIAEIDQYRISHHALHLMAAGLSVYMMLLFTLYLFVARGDISSAMPPRFFAFILFVGLLMVLLCPFDVLLRKTRWWILCKSARVVSAPFLQVRFVDFFLADQFTSMVLVLYDVFFAVCYCVSDIWTGDSVCVNIIPTARLCLAGLPNLWRFLQCLRRYRDSKDVVNLANAGKYSSGLMVVLWAGVSKGLDPNNDMGWTAFRVLLVVFSVIATAYTSFWDIKMDFGFFAKGTKHKALRSELLYSPKLKYYLIMPVDVILRLTWIFTIAPESFGITISPDLYLFCLSIGELTRRFLWNFFRMENESASNCGKFRAVADVPLPYGEDDNEIAAREEREEALLLDEQPEGLKKFLNQFDSDDDSDILVGRRGRGQRLDVDFDQDPDDNGDDDDDDDDDNMGSGGVRKGRDVVRGGNNDDDDNDDSDDDDDVDSDEIGSHGQSSTKRRAAGSGLASALSNVSSSSSSSSSDDDEPHDDVYGKRRGDASSSSSSSSSSAESSSSVSIIAMPGNSTVAVEKIEIDL